MFASSMSKGGVGNQIILALGNKRSKQGSSATCLSWFLTNSTKAHHFSIILLNKTINFGSTMPYKSPILIIEDDADDCELIESALASLGVKNQRKCFNNGQEALEYLQSTAEKTFLILSDVNMPLLTGLQLKEIINRNDKLRTQSIPFVFLSTSNSKNDINAAYDLLAQGFFTKPNKYDDLIDILKKVTNYWETAKRPVA